MTSRTGLRSVAITGTGSAFPSRLVTNADLAAHLGQEVAAQVGERHGVAQRYWCSAEESTADLAEEAARAAIADAGLEAHEVGLLVVATDSPEFVTPPTAAVVHGRLELPNAFALDVSAGGADFIAALDLACRAVRADAHLRHAVVVGASVVSKYLDMHDARTAPLYGDGAAAVVVSAQDADGVLAVASRTMGQYSHDVGVFAGGTRTPITHVVLDAALQNRLRVSRDYPAELPSAWAALVGDTISAAGMPIDAVTHWMYAHPSKRALSDTALLVGDTVDLEPSFAMLGSNGYTGAAALPLALDDAARTGRLHDDDVVLLTAAGAGVSLGVAVLRWTARANR